AVKWSNPIEGSIRFTVHADGSVPVDEHGRAVSEDMYAGAEYDAARARVARFNERWITVQGGFTPHGPNIEDVEAAYPYATTVRHLTAPDSPFAHPIVDDTAETVQQGKWAGTFNALGYQAYTPGVAKMAVDTAAPQTILVHEGFFSLGPDGPIQVQRFLEYVRQVSGYATIDQAVAHSAVKLIVVFESEVGEPMKPAEANELFRTLIATVNDATDGATSLKPEWFTVATEKPQGAVAVALGPSNWLQTIPQAGVKVTVNEGRSAAAAFSAGIEAAATGGVLAESIKTKLDVDSLAEVGVISPRELKASGQLDTELEHYQTTVRGARGNL
ncbi:MAG: hypothetical protein HY599_05545, partial [Candidatus Omnitrophica bacterium]|nr:hypothetical protein [Candidatus Omnitrophota bacterium]